MPVERFEMPTADASVGPVYVSGGHVLASLRAWSSFRFFIRSFREGRAATTTYYAEPACISAPTRSMAFISIMQTLKRLDGEDRADAELGQLVHERRGDLEDA